MKQPQIIILAGPNGAGKSTIAPSMVSDRTEFLNADDIVKDLVAQGVASPDLRAGRQLLKRWDELSAAKQNFAVETTLATRSFAPCLMQMQQAGYRVQVVFV